MSEVLRSRYLEALGVPEFLYAEEKLKDTFFSTFNEDENVESRITIPLPEDS